MRPSADLPLVSVVIPAFNRARTVEQTLDSVQAKTYPRWEAIVVDDGSTDDTVERVERKAREDGRIRVMRHGRNGGAQAARNVGIRAAGGEWIAFLDSDDRFLPDSLERRLRIARAENVSVVHSECYIQEEDAEPRLYGIRPLRGRAYRQLLQREGPVFPGLLVRREALRRIGFLDEKIVSFQEWDTALRLARRHRFAFEPEPTFIWDCRGRETISKDLARGGRGVEQILRKHFKPMLLLVGPGLVAAHYRNAADWYRNGGDLESAERCERSARSWSAWGPRTALSNVRGLFHSSRP